MVGGQADGILILADASCGNFPQHTQEKRHDVKCPLLSRCGDLSRLPLKMVFPASGARRQTLGELTAVPLRWNSMRCGA